MTPFERIVQRLYLNRKAHDEAERQLEQSKDLERRTQELYRESLQEVSRYSRTNNYRVIIGDLVITIPRTNQTALRTGVETVQVVPVPEEASDLQEERETRLRMVDLPEVEEVEDAAG